MLSTPKLIGELRKQYDEKLGVERSTIYVSLYAEVVYLNSKWIEFKRIFNSSKERIDLLNETAPSFFSLLQIVLFENILLHLSCLTDRQNIGDNQNLTIQTLVLLFKGETISESLSNQIKTVEDAVKPARKWRDKYISHRDLDMAINPLEKPMPNLNYSDIENTIKEINRLLNIIESHYFNSVTIFEGHVSTSNADSFIRLLNYGKHQMKKRRERFNTGQLLPEDHEPLPHI